MNPRIPAIVVLLALTGIVIFLVLPREKISTSPSETSQTVPALTGQSRLSTQDPPKILPDSAISLAQQPDRAQPAEMIASGIAVFPGAAELLSGFNNSEHPPTYDLELIETVVLKYRQVFGHNPSGGTNAEIMASLTGQNSKALAIVPPDFPALNMEGELIDRWGTPYFFHPVSRQVIEVMSAGPDALLWTSDDVGSIEPAGPEAQLR